ncbi:MAG TPA: hypothetical protein VGZ73_23900, partial [Bryobacteraceae bacterium]|nr:hypothetical protein [Bryobacteraceae bacterium]
AFEMQLGPFAVAQLRIYAELMQLVGHTPRTPVRMFVTDSLANPYVELEQLGSWYAPIGESRRQANRIKIQEPITVVLGNPPYKEKAKGRGGWIEEGDTARACAPQTTHILRVRLIWSMVEPYDSSRNNSVHGAERWPFFPHPLATSKPTYRFPASLPG